MKALNIKKLSISKRMILVYVLCVLLPACTLIYIYYLKSSDIIETEVAGSMLQTLKQCNINISNILNNIAETSDEIFLDPEVQQFVGDENNDDILLQYNQVKKIKQMFSSISNKRDIYHIRMFVSEKKIASGERVNFFSVRDIVDRKWYEKVVNNYGGIVWTGVYKENYNDAKDVNIISCARVLKHSLNYTDNDGVLLMDIPESNIYSVLSDINTGNGKKIYIIDQDGYIISDRDKSKLGENILNIRELEYINSSPSGIKKTNKNGRDFLIIYQEIDATGWKLVAELDSKDVIKTNTIFNNISVFVVIIITFIIAVFGIILLAVHIMDSMSKQVKNLAGIIEKEGVEEIDDSMTYIAKGDLTRLEKQVYSMIQKIKKLMDESYQSKIKEREAQLNALQAQINPHFLYNTLDTINWMAVKMNAREISFMVNSLAKYFRLSLSKGKTIVSIKDELELIKIYLTIQQVRYKGVIQFEFMVEEDVENYKMQKLTIQPIVENAIIHGLQKNVDRSGVVIIEARKIGQDIVFTVSDNGAGMEKEIVEKVLNNLPDGKEGSYGLYNVNERIKLYFGNEYGISIQSEKGVGTKVELKIKAVMEG